MYNSYNLFFQSFNYDAHDNLRVILIITIFDFYTTNWQISAEVNVYSKNLGSN